MEFACIEAEKNDIADVVALASALWPHADKDELKKEFNDALLSSRECIFICKSGATSVAFAHAALRHEHVEGATSSPVGYLEGIYVQPEFRNQGVAKKLVELIEMWAKERGCSEMASDTEIENSDSRQFHQNIGFQEVGVVVCFLKKIDHL